MPISSTATRSTAILCATCSDRAADRNGGSHQGCARGRLDGTHAFPFDNLTQARPGGILVDEVDLAAKHIEQASAERFQLAEMVEPAGREFSPMRTAKSTSDAPVASLRAIDPNRVSVSAPCARSSASCARSTRSASERDRVGPFTSQCKGQVRRTRAQHGSAAAACPCPGGRVRPAGFTRHRCPWSPKRNSPAHRRLVPSFRATQSSR
jgi:hypothetical protein